MIVFSKTAVIDLPSDFPAAVHDEVYEILARQKDRPCDMWEEFAVAWSGVAYRFSSAALCESFF